MWVLHTVLRIIKIYSYPFFNHMVVAHNADQDLEFLEPEAGVADVEVALFAEVFDLYGDGDDDGVDGGVDGDDVDGDHD